MVTLVGSINGRHLKVYYSLGSVAMNVKCCHRLILASIYYLIIINYTLIFIMIYTSHSINITQAIQLIHVNIKIIDLIDLEHHWLVLVVF